MRARGMLRGLLVGTALLGASLGFVPVPAADGANTDAATQLVALTNSLRISRGLPALQLDATLTAKAQGWAQHMVDTGVLAHSTLTAGLPASWQRVGENVGRGGDVVTVHDALVASPGHLKNLVDPGFTLIGVAVVDAPGGVYVAEVFMQTRAPATPRVGPNGAPRPAPVVTAPAAPARLTAVLERLRALEG